MPTFDPDNPYSAEGACLWEMAALLSECTYFQLLTETHSVAAAREKIKIGVGEGPWDGDTYSLDEIAETFIEAHLTWPMQGERLATQSDGSPTPEQSGEFILTIRRHIRESEAAELLEQSGLDHWFYDVISAIEIEILTLAETRLAPRVRSVQRMNGPAVSDWKTQSAQGEFIWVQHRITWGDSVGE